MTASGLPALTRYNALRRHLELLASIEPSDAPFLSCCLDLSRGDEANRAFLEQRAEEIRGGLEPVARADFDSALDALRTQLRRAAHPKARGLALFTRGRGGGRFSLAMHFAAPIADNLSFYPVPDLYPLVDLMDRQGRYALVLVRPDWMQSAEVDLGAESVGAWTALPRSGRGTGAESGGAHAQRQARLLQRLLRSNGYTRFFLAGNAVELEELRACLTPQLAARLLGTLPLTVKQGLPEALAASFDAFRDMRLDASRSVAEHLLHGLRHQGPAAGGSLAVWDALQRGAAESLILRRDCRPAPLPLCRRCGEYCAVAVDGNRCPACLHGPLQAVDMRAELLRLALQQDVPVELVDTDALSFLGGVGCLLTPRGQAASQVRPRRHGPLDLVA